MKIFEKKAKSEEQVIKEMEELLSALLLDQKELYINGAQDFSISDNKADLIIKRLSALNTQIKSQQTKIDNKKREFGWTNKQIITSRQVRKSRP